MNLETSLAAAGIAGSIVAGMALVVYLLVWYSDENGN